VQNGLLEKNCEPRESVFFISSQTLDATRKNALPYDDWSSGAIIYAYVEGNPVSKV
jgi:hypothetical protein